MKNLSEMKIGRLSNVFQCLLIGIVTSLVLFSLIFTGITPDQYDIHLGEPASKTVYATKDVEDTVTTEALRDAAANAVEPSYKSVDSSVNTAVIADLEHLLQKMEELYAEYAPESGSVDDALIQSFDKSAPVSLTQEGIRAFLSANGETLENLAADCASIVRDEMNSILPEGQENATITRITRNLLGGNYSPALVGVYAEIIRSCIRPNMPVDQEITEANREKAREAVNPEILVKREAIVREGEIVTEAQYKMIESLGLLDNDKLDIPLICGLLLVVFALCGMTALCLHLFNPAILRQPNKLLLLCIIVVLELALSLLVRGVNSYLMPVALSAILISILMNYRTALFVNAAVSCLASMMVSSDGVFSMAMFAVLLMAIASGSIAAFVLSKRQMRVGTILAGAGIAASNFVLVLAVGLISSSNVQTALTNACWAFGGGVFSAVLAIGLQSLLEWLFNVATNAKLIELSNPNQPLLKRLLMEAPGTYHHSIIVANLAEAGVTAVGGNGLLARVGAYYHDIGKLKRPMYFKENQLGDNPHDRTDPRVSAAILTAHPRDGAQMGAKERLPEAVVDIIRQHHGDSLVLFFYDKATKIYGEDMDVTPFRYDGPRPRSKEAAVVMLADSIEAATRTLVNPSPERMEQLIRKLVREKMDDGQLNDSALTFSDLDKICSTFVTVLTGVFHERIEYPEIAIPPRKPIAAEESGDEAEAGEADAETAPAAETADSENTEAMLHAD